MKKIKAVLTAFMITVLMTGCAGDSSITYTPTESGIFFMRSGDVSSSLVETFEQGEYNQEELKTYVDEAVIAYNTANNAAAAAENTTDGLKLPVAVSSCTVADQKAIVVFDYATASDMLSFNEQEEGGLDISAADVMAVPDAVASGKLADLSMKKADGTSVLPSELSQKSKLYVATVEGSVTVQTEGKVEYVSDGVTVIDKNTVKTPGGKAYIVFK